MKKLIIVVLVFPFVSFAQQKVNGVITELNAQNKTVPLPGANVYWLGTTVGTTTGIEGSFSIPYSNEYKKLLISYVGYKTDTLTISNYKAPIQHTLTAVGTLNEVLITGKRQPTSQFYLAAQNVTTISSAELLKAACCNLSESFETNPSIDVNFADAVSGTRQIKMLGLTSPYLLIATENIPTVRGAAQAFGLSFTPGTWVESIQVTKGAGSVVNGYESIAGQINVELQKPETDNTFFLNLYGASNQRLELNTHYNTAVSNRWSTGVYLHSNTHQKEHDVNHDNFLDMPKYNQLNVMNRWQYSNPEKGLISFLNVRYLTDNKQTGELSFNPDIDKLTTNHWGSEIDTKRFDFSGKLGYVNPQVSWQSVGFQVAFSNHEQESYFGLNQYNIKHNSIYSNLLYNTIISDSRHKIKTGLSFALDYYNELVLSNRYIRTDNSTGAFVEYSFDNLDKLTLTAGLRADMHNRLGVFLTPRFHARYTPWEKAAFKISFGRGKRMANIFAENQNLFATSRVVKLLNSGGNIYGLDPEVAWNYGVSYLQGFNLLNRKASISVDYYRTDFKNQVVVDWENPQEISFYNLDGESFANSFQTEFHYNPFEHFDLRLAYKYYDVQTDYVSGKKVKPLTPKHRMFINASYETHLRGNNKEKQWKFDATYNWIDKQRFASTASNPLQYKLPKYSPTVATLNVQVTRVFSPKFEMYVGGENITNVRQDNPILAADNPFGSYFDTTFVYGPIFGSMYYAGLRFKIE